MRTYLIVTAFPPHGPLRSFSSRSIRDIQSMGSVLSTALRWRSAESNHHHLPITEPRPVRHFIDGVPVPAEASTASQDSEGWYADFFEKALCLSHEMARASSSSSLMKETHIPTQGQGRVGPTNVCKRRTSFRMETIKDFPVCEALMHALWMLLTLTVMLVSYIVAPVSSSRGSRPAQCASHFLR
jgi:hypothetical protein